MITAEVSVEHLQALFIKNKVAHYNYHVLEIFVTEINVGICRTVWQDVSKKKNHMYLRKICPRLIKKKTSGMETFYLSLTLTKAAFVDAFKAFN